jgi:hypothetical protein
LSDELKSLRENTDRRFAILMTALQDFMGALNQERNRMINLLEIQEKAVSKEQIETKPKKKTKQQ